ncbi:MAG: hypothetical protein LUC86_03705 [Prevotellaceae bacterium]|nr:hypothetical protein [Prevotellaceae bacterium]
MKRQLFLLMLLALCSLGVKAQDTDDDGEGTEATEPSPGDIIHFCEAEYDEWTYTNNATSSKGDFAYYLNLTGDAEHDATTDDSEMTPPYLEIYGTDKRMRNFKAEHEKLTGLTSGTYLVRVYARLRDTNSTGNGVTKSTPSFYANGNSTNLYSNAETKSDHDAYGLYEVYCTVTDGTLDCYFQKNANDVVNGYNWVSWKNFEVIYLGDEDAYIGDATASTSVVEKDEPITISFDVSTDDNGYILADNLDDIKLNGKTAEEGGSFSIEYDEEDNDGTFTFTMTEEPENGVAYVLTFLSDALEWDDAWQTVQTKSKEQTLVFYKQDLTDNKEGVYLLNVGDTEFLSRGDQWGTEADVDPYGIPVDITKADDGLCTIKFLDSGGYMCNPDWAFTDASESDASHYAFQEVEGATSSYGTVYQLIGGSADVADGLLYVNDNTNGLPVANNGQKDEGDQNYSEDAQAQWIIVDKDTRDKIKAAWLKAQKDAIAATVGETDLDTFVAALDEDDLVDETEQVTNAALANSTDGWEFSYTDNEYYNGGQFQNYVETGEDGEVTVDDYGVELYMGYASMTQTVSGLTPGVYKVTLQGFLRQGSNVNCYAIDHSYDLSIAYLRANGNEINLKPWSAGSSLNEDAAGTEEGDYTPNGMSDASTLCDAEGSAYTNTLYTTVGSDGTLDLTIGCPGSDDRGWMYVKTLTLTRLVAYNLFVNEDPQEEGTYYGTFSDASTSRTADGITGLTAYYLLKDGVTPEGDQTYGELEFVEATDGIAPEQGYLCKYKGDADQGTLCFYLDKAGSEVTALEGNLMKAVSEAKELTDDYDYVLSAVDGVVAFYKLDESSTVPAGKAYVDLSSLLGTEDEDALDVKAFKIVFSDSASDEGTATGIETAAPSTEGSSAIYDLTGRRVSQPLKSGVYIKGGKKVLY